MMNTHKRRNKQYRTVKRIRRYNYKLVERSFCLDINFLSRNGFFRAGRGPRWDYECRTEKEKYIGGAYLTLVDSEHEDEFGIKVDAPLFFMKPVIVRVIYRSHPLVRWRQWFLCPKCKHKVIFLHIPPGEFDLACRMCHKLVYWSQMRGKKRIGQEEYARRKELYRVHKSIVMDASAIE